MAAATATTSRSLAKVAQAADKAVLALELRNVAIIIAHENGATIRAIAERALLSPARVHQIIHGR